MKIAYLITAHSQPGHLHRLIQALDMEGSSFYIHVDGKADLQAFKNYSYSNHVHFIDRRMVVHHAGFLLVPAMINLIQTALADREVQYFITLSGWDYPIKDTRYINDYLTQNYPTNFMNFYPLTKKADLSDNVRKFHFIDWIGFKPGFMQKPLKAVQLLVRRLPFDRPFIPGMVPYRGSAWFCLNRETLQYIADFLKTEEGINYLNYFKWVESPDEIVFQTLVFNSPYASQCRFYERDFKNNTVASKNENKAYLHYIDWDPGRENPTQFTMADFQKIKNSEALFARKFNEIKSKEVLDAIDKIILKKSETSQVNQAEPAPKPGYLFAEGQMLEVRSK